MPLVEHFQARYASGVTLTPYRLVGGVPERVYWSPEEVAGALTLPFTIPAMLVASTFRDPLQQPFASSSIWNTPIGSSASYVAAGFDRTPATFAEMPGTDPMRICLTPTAPSTQIRYSSVGWNVGDRCPPTSATVVATVPMPADWLVPDSNKNECASFLASDGRTVVQVQPLARCTASTVGTAIVKYPDQDLYGPGIEGAQGGSGLSALGGTLRVGELRPGELGPRHALKCVINTGKYLFKATAYAEAYRWPATKADSGAVGVYGAITNNTNTAMKMGSLLALLPASTLPTTLRTIPGRQLAWTLQNYGCYVVDGTGDDFLIPTEEGYHGSFMDQFLTDYGFRYDQRANEATPWVLDVQDCLEALHCVNNNSSTSVGGGGTPRQPLVPELVEP